MSQPQSPAGALVIIGGGGTPSEVHEVFFQIAGGKQARVVHIPSATAQFEEIENKREYYCDFYDREPASFEFLHTNERSEAEASGFANLLNDATGVWMGGGNQNRLASLFLDTEVVSGIHGVLARGGVVAGTSSGASIMSQTMICCGYEEIELGPAFGLYPRTIVDPHFTQRGREHRLATAVLQQPRHVGIGIDEKVALIVQGNRLRAIGPGTGSVWFFFPQRRGGKVLRCELRIGETAQLMTAALGAPHKELRAALEAHRPAQRMALQELLSPESAGLT